MLSYLDNLYIKAAIKTRNFIDSFKNDERGVSAIIATVILILMVVLLASVFWKQITQWFGNMWKTINENNTFEKPTV